MIIFLHSVHHATGWDVPENISWSFQYRVSLKDSVHRMQFLLLSEYICDYATGETVEKGWKVIEKNLEKLEAGVCRTTREKIEKNKNGREGSVFLNVKGRVGEWENGKRTRRKGEIAVLLRLKKKSGSS